MATVTETKTFYLSELVEEHSSYKGISDPDKFKNCDTASTTYTRFTSNTGSRATTTMFLKFDTSELPADAVITSASVSVKAYASGSNIWSQRQARPYYLDENDAEVTLKTSQNLTASAAIYTWDFTSPSRAYFDKFCIRLYGLRTTSNTTTAAYFYAYGGTLTVTYEYEEQDADRLYTKVDGIWTPVARAFKKINGVWVAQEDLTTVFDSSNTYIKGS